MRSLLLAALLLPAFAHSTEIVRWRQTPNQTEFRVLHQEGAVTMIETFAKPAGRLQEVRESLTVKNPAEARRVFDRLTAGWESQPPPPSPNLKTDPGQEIWIAHNDWNEEWENTYRDWIKTNATSDYLFDHQVATDCADVAYAYRWIFARIHSLPMANRIAGSADLLTNESADPSWSTLPTDPEWHKDRRFRRALNYLLRNTYTHTLMREFYPVALDSKQLNSGAIFLDLYSANSGHTQMVRTFILDDNMHPNPFRILASTVPREVRRLYEYGFGLEDWPKANERGFFRFRWSAKTSEGWQTAAPGAMPGYSLEQFDPELPNQAASIQDLIMRRLLPDWAPNFQRAMKEAVAEMLAKLTVRAQAVTEGFAYCQVHDCSPGTHGWELYSTPSRDHALTEIAGRIFDLFAAGGCDDACTDEFAIHANDPIAETESGSVDLNHAAWAFRSSLISSDPRDPLTRRWATEY